MPSPLSRLTTGLKYSSILARTLVLKNWNEAASRRYLIESLGSMPGISAKAAQFMAMKLGEGAHRQDNPVSLEPMPLALVKARIAAEAPRLHAELLEISEQAQVASLGQVHEGLLRSGERVAIKVQFPDLQKSFDEQLGLLRQVSKAGPPKKFRFEMEAILDYFADSLQREVDYEGEAQRQMEAARLLPKNKPIVVARVYPEYSSRTILTQSYEASSPISRIKERPEEARRECARALLEYFLHAVFVARSVHTDPHPGNLGFRTMAPQDGRNYELVLYDFGSTMTLTEKDVSTLWNLIHAYQNQRDVVPFDEMVALGFDAQKLLPLRERLPCLMEKLLEPFCVDRDFDFQSWNLKDHFESVLGADRWWFRSAGPPWFLMLMRSMQGLVHALCELKVAVPVKRILLDLPLEAPKEHAPSVLAQLSPSARGSC
ncbi:MAG TPA: AarF/UbiB family protein [Oligoflexus sp.]|uniref:AarF/UbiB family protein n=1 Tax=Oligoflexus sp. TaxID=1971216 RepID=UPI002D80F37F|nr:AarF/UbiB family protein [Oligoflexus sp.]HET9237922.1 AarF/UbiB family protein [Oligoflexus sp.]